MNSIKQKISFIALFALLAIASPRLQAAALHTTSAAPLLSPTDVLSPAGEAASTPRFVVAEAERVAADSASVVVPVPTQAAVAPPTNIVARAWATISPYARRAATNTISGIWSILKNPTQPGPMIPFLRHAPSKGTVVAGTTLAAYISYKQFAPKSLQLGVDKAASAVTAVPRFVLMVGGLWALWNYHTTLLQEVKDDTNVIRQDTAALKIKMDALTTRAARMQDSIDANEKAAQKRHVASQASLAQAQAELKDAINKGKTEVIEDLKLKEANATTRHAETAQELKRIQYDAKRRQVRTHTQLANMRAQMAAEELEAKKRSETQMAATASVDSRVGKLSAEMKEMVRIFKEQTQGFTTEQREILFALYNQANAGGRAVLVKELSAKTAEELKVWADKLLAQQSVVSVATMAAARATQDQVRAMHTKLDARHEALGNAVVEVAQAVERTQADLQDERSLAAQRHDQVTAAFSAASTTQQRHINMVGSLLQMLKIRYATAGLKPLV